jgi:hypothetical protein
VRLISGGDYGGHLRASLAEWAERNAVVGSWIQVPGHDVFCERLAATVRLAITPRLPHQVKCRSLLERFSAPGEFISFLAAHKIARPIRVQVGGRKLRVQEILPGGLDEDPSDGSDAPGATDDDSQVAEMPWTAAAEAALQ